MDLTTISTALSSIKTATDIAKLIKESGLSLEKAEANLKLAELISALADAKIQIADIQQLLLDKDNELRAANERLAVKEKLQWEKPYYWLIVDNQKDGPFCQHCYDKHKELIRLQGNGEGYWDCKACKSSYTDSTWDTPSVQTVRSGRNPVTGY